MKQTIKKINDKLINLLYPLRCPVCDRPVFPRSRLVCASCIRLLKPLREPFCEKCGKKLMVRDGSRKSPLCHDCTERQHSFKRCRSAFEYSCSKEMIYRFKYLGRREYAAAFAQLSEKILADYIYGNDPDMIACVPISKKRLIKRGYNQAEELSRELSRITGIPFCSDAIRRVKNTRPLKMLTPKERQNNLKNAFKTGENVVKSKRILLVDDIYTTGATMDACADILLKSGAECVFGLTLTSGTGV